MNIYLDIDGVLLKDSLAEAGQPADHALEFLQTLTDKHNCFWLTTHCKSGENHVDRVLKGKFPKEIIDKILPTSWESWKTEALDFRYDFRWLDDDVYEPELQVLEDHKCLNKLIKIDLRQNPNQLLEIIEKI